MDSEKLAEYLQMEASMPGLLSELVTAFLQDAPTRITTAELALAEGNANRARDAAHALKGAALQMGTLPLGRAAAELEREAQAGSLEQGRALLERIVTEFDRARPVLEQYLAAAQPSGVA